MASSAFAISLGLYYLLWRPAGLGKSKKGFRTELAIAEIAPAKIPAVNNLGASRSKGKAIANTPQPLPK